ncbi:hypothetical protein [Corynebacterium lizhenjunii]|uniref:hypothetical protein n=1 Tax=Corynebacterium lizhenjunii TaxID=2709394 RepID=UPI0013EDA5DC|nr:hypothetical protein [Corynebacterium lizhenjunii]
MFVSHPWLRFVEGVDGGAATAPEPTDAPTDTAGDTQEEGAGDEVDYKAKYEAMKKHSREWEAKAKANKKAADRLKEIEDADKSEAERLTEQLAASEKDNAVLRAELNRMTIAAKHGLSAEDAELFLHGDTEAMEAQAQALAGRRVKVGGAEAPAQGRGASSATTREAIVERAKKL